MRTYILIILMLLLVVGCGRPEYLSEKELNEYILSEDNGLTKTVSANNIDLRLSYRPTDLLVGQELRNNSNPSSMEVKKLRDKYSTHLYFVLSLSHDHHEVITPAVLGPDRFSDLLQTVSFRMSQYANLTTPTKDTVAVADYIYNRTFGMSGSSDLLLVFDKSKSEKSGWIQFNLKEFGLGLGNQSLVFQMEDIKSAPKIYQN